MLPKMLGNKTLHQRSQCQCIRTINYNSGERMASRWNVSPRQFDSSICERIFQDQQSQFFSSDLNRALECVVKTYIELNCGPCAGGGARLVTIFGRKQKTATGCAGESRRARNNVLLSGLCVHIFSFVRAPRSGVMAERIPNRDHNNGSENQRLIKS